MIKTLVLILSGILILGSCNASNSSEDKKSQAKYTYSLNGWENLGSQTLVLIDASNPSKLEQDIKFKIEVFNKAGERFTKDTTIHFKKKDKKIDFQLLVETSGEIEKVEVIAFD